MCWDGGDLLICDYCPAAWHAACLTADARQASTSSLIWACPHHRCVHCKRKASAAGLIFRCEMCERAFCEDCMPEDVEVRVGVGGVRVRGRGRGGGGVVWVMGGHDVVWIMLYG